MNPVLGSDYRSGYTGCLEPVWLMTEALLTKWYQQTPSISCGMLPVSIHRLWVLTCLLTYGRMLSGLGRNVQTCWEHFSLSTSMLLGMPPSYLSDVLLRHSMQHYSVEMFSRALATIEFIMVRCRLLSIAELTLSCSDLAQCIFEVCTWHRILFLSFIF